MTGAPAHGGVSRVEVFELAVPVSPARGDARGNYPVRRTLVVRLVSTDGIEGWGQGGWPEGPVIDHVRACARHVGDGHSAGVPCEVAAAFDLAWHDVRGRREGVGLAQLLGGARRTDVLAYASVHNYGEGLKPGAEALAALEAARACGLGGLKVKVGRGPVAEESRWLERLRAAAPDVALMADANQTYDRETARRMGEVLAALGAVWFEEPISRDDVEGYLWLGQRLTVPLAGGEDCHGPDEVDSWARTRATPIVQANLARIGGPSVLAEVRERVGQSARHFALHCWNAPLLHAATLHGLSLTEELGGDARWFTALETTTLPPAPPLLGTPPLLREGRFVLPEGNGLGVDVDADYVRKHSASVAVVD